MDNPERRDYYSVTTKNDIKLCNCARCNRVLLGDSMREYGFSYLRLLWGASLPPFVHERILDRPYCGECSGAVEQKTPRIDFFFRRMNRLPL